MNIARIVVRPFEWAPLAMIWLFAMPAASQTTAGDMLQKTQAAYELALKCYVADAHAYFDRRDANDQNQAAYFDQQARHSFATAVSLSKQLGYSNDRFGTDEKAISDRELPQIIKDPVYARQVAAECKAYGLM